MRQDDKAWHVRHNEGEQRFEADTVAGLGVAEYRRRGDTLVFTHTEVPSAVRGRGLGGRLARAGLEHARATNARVVPQCPFIAAWLARHPEFEDLRAR